jgi:hypothetical protein
MAKYLVNNNGTITEVQATGTSAGAADAAKIPQLDGTGRLDSSMMPVGLGADTQQVQASEALAAGDLVNIFDGGAGVFRARKADASTTGKRAHGFVLQAYASAAQALVYFEGTDTQQTAVPPGELFLSAATPGKVAAAAPTGSGQTVQRVGFGTSGTTFNFQAGEPITLA